jgi:putative membrane protein
MFLMGFLFRGLPVILFFFSSSSWGHGGHDHPSRWNWDLFTLLSLAALVTGHALGLRNLKLKHGKPFGKMPIASYYLSILFLFIALVSPIDALSDELQSWHMIQHMIIMMIAAPLFVMGAPLYVFLWGFSISWRKKITPIYRWLYGYKTGWYFFWQPLLLWGVYAFTMWIWHLPRFYEAALRNELLHDFQHISFFITSCLFWRLMLDPIHRFKLKPALGIIYVFATSLHATLLGVFMALAPSVWYPFYEGRTIKFNLSALEDQQLAGLIMWMPACMIYVLVSAYLFILWLKKAPEVAR